jgi:hypothetical protein
MSWVQKELKKRTRGAVRDSAPVPGPQGNAVAQGVAAKIVALWERLEAANNALPNELKLRRELVSPATVMPDRPAFSVVLVAHNDACLGFTEDGIRYIWPVRNARKSNNFWIRWRAGEGYLLNRRVGWSWSGASTVDRKFKDSSVELMLKCMVTGVRIRPGAVCGKRFWLF